MNIEEMFPTKPEQTIAQRIIEVLQKYPDSNVIELGEHLWKQKTASAKASANPSLYIVIKNLQSLSIVVCRIDPFKLDS